MSQKTLQEITRWLYEPNEEYQCPTCDSWYDSEDGAQSCCPLNSRNVCGICGERKCKSKHDKDGLKKYAIVHREAMLRATVELEGRSLFIVSNGHSALITETQLHDESWHTPAYKPDWISNIWEAFKATEKTRSTIGELKERINSEIWQQEEFTSPYWRPNGIKLPLITDQLPLFLDCVSDESPIEYAAFEAKAFKGLWISGEGFHFINNGERV